MGPARGLRNLPEEATHQSEKPPTNYDSSCNQTATLKLLIL